MEGAQRSERSGCSGAREAGPTHSGPPTHARQRACQRSIGCAMHIPSRRGSQINHSLSLSRRLHSATPLSRSERARARAAEGNSGAQRAAAAAAQGGFASTHAHGSMNHQSRTLGEACRRMSSRKTAAAHTGSIARPWRADQTDTTEHMIDRGHKQRILFVALSSAQRLSRNRKQSQSFKDAFSTESFCS